MTNDKSHIFIFGFGYVATHFAKVAQKLGFCIVGTSRDEAKRAHYAEKGITLFDFSDQHAIKRALQQTTYLLISVAPNSVSNELETINSVCPVLNNYQELLTEAVPNLKWIGYLSSTGVYGDHQGAWVSENALLNANHPIHMARIKAEAQWLSFGEKYQIPTHIFRLAGIYGPGRNALVRLKNQQAQCIHKPNHYFSRIHVDDIANVLLAAIATPQSNEIFNVSDDYPSPGEDVVLYAAKLLNISAPKVSAFDQAKLTQAGRRFYEQNKRVANHKIKQILGVTLQYPDYHRGLRQLLKVDG